MGYSECLEAAGAEILHFQEFGDYQGSWGAIVVYNGVKSLVTGSYGSCSGCDSFQSEFDYGDSEPKERNGKYYKNSDTWDEEKECNYDDYIKAKEKYNKRLSDFAQSYLNTPYQIEDIEREIKAKESDEWSFDEDDLNLYKWALPLMQ